MSATLSLITTERTQTYFILRHTVLLHDYSHCVKPWLYIVILSETYRNKSVISLVPQMSTWHCQHLLLSTLLWHHRCWVPGAHHCWLISPAHGVLSSKPTAHQWAVSQWDRRKDGRAYAQPFHWPCSTYYAGSVIKTSVLRYQYCLWLWIVRLSLLLCKILLFFLYVPWYYCLKDRKGTL